MIHFSESRCLESAAKMFLICVEHLGGQLSVPKVDLEKRRKEGEGWYVIPVAHGELLPVCYGGLQPEPDREEGTQRYLVLELEASAIVDRTHSARIAHVTMCSVTDNKVRK